MTRLFIFGTLLDDALREIVLGGAIAGQAATLGGYTIQRAADGDWPILVLRDGAEATGLLLDLDDTAMDRAAFYEAAFQYVAQRSEIPTARLRATKPPADQGPQRRVDRAEIGRCAHHVRGQRQLDHAGHQISEAPEDQRRHQFRQRGHQAPRVTVICVTSQLAEANVAAQEVR